MLIAILLVFGSVAYAAEDTQNITSDKDTVTVTIPVEGYIISDVDEAEGNIPEGIAPPAQEGTGTRPKTGDESWSSFYLMLIVASAVIVLMLVVNKKKEKDNENKNSTERGTGNGL